MHLRAPDFLDVESHPKITFEGDRVEIIGDHDFVVRGDLTIRGVTHEVPLRVSYLGSWPTQSFSTPTWAPDKREVGSSSLPRPIGQCAGTASTFP